MINTFINVFNRCGLHTYSTLFPKDETIKNKYTVYIVNILHILGVIVIQFGLFLPPFLIKYYILYLVFLFITYTLLNNRCFMTVLSNYSGEKNYNPLCIKMKEAQYFLGIFLGVAVIFYVNPEYSLFVILKKILLNLK